MTMGMILACVEGEYPIEHIPTEYDPVTFEPKGPCHPSKSPSTSHCRTSSSQRAIRNSRLDTSIRIPIQTRV